MTQLFKNKFPETRESRVRTFNGRIKDEVGSATISAITLFREEKARKAEKSLRDGDWGAETTLYLAVHPSFNQL